MKPFLKQEAMQADPQSSACKRLAFALGPILLIASLWLAAAPASAQSGTLKRYWNDTYKFGLSYPADARVEIARDPAAAQGEVIKVSAKGVNVVCIANAIADTGAQKISPDDHAFLKEMMDLMSKKMLEGQFGPDENGQVTRLATVTLGGRPARFFETRITNKAGTAILGRNWLTVIPNHFFSLNCASPPAAFATPAAQAFMAAIRDGVRFSK